MIKTKSVFSAIEPSKDGLRILATRFRGRGMPASRYDVWMANLGPSEGLLRGMQKQELTWGEFSRRYRKELFEGAPLTGITPPSKTTVKSSPCDSSSAWPNAGTSHSCAIAPRKSPTATATS